MQVTAYHNLVDTNHEVLGKVLHINTNDAEWRLQLSSSKVQSMDSKWIFSRC
jgi:hypothetical protein